MHKDTYKNRNCKSEKRTSKIKNKDTSEYADRSNKKFSIISRSTQYYQEYEINLHFSQRNLKKEDATTHTQA